MQVLRSLTSHGRVATPCLALLALLAVGGCENDPDEKAPACPIALTRPDASSLTRYDGRGTDLTDLVLNARITNVKGFCKGQLGHKTLDAHAHIEMLVTRGPAAQGRDMTLQYNVAVMHNGVILERKPYVQHIVFPPNVDSVQVQGEEIPFTFTTERGLTGPSYKIYFVLQLTPEELAANQRALQAK
jgi:hypothetical protein